MMIAENSDKDWLVICTCNRKDNLWKLLNSLSGAELTNLVGIVIVDSSDEPIQLNIFQEINLNIENKIVINSEIKNLAFQRNKALNFLEEKRVRLVHFLDDDIDVPKDYFQTKVKIFENVSTGVVAIIGGVEINTSEKRRTNLSFGELARSGKVSRSGVNYKIRKLKKARRVDWISGMMLSLNYEILRDIRFSENLLGNSVGEDVIYCLQASRRGAILADPNVYVYHHMELSNRESPVSNRNSYNHYRLEACRMNLKVNKYLLLASLLTSAVKYKVIARVFKRDYAYTYYQIDKEWAIKTLNYILNKKSAHVQNLHT